MQLIEQDLKEWGVKVNTSLYIPYFNEYLNQYGIVTKNKLVAFFANLLHESGNLYYKQEIASGIAYENRADLGNTQKGDGVKFAGKAFAQITGRANFRAFTIWCRANIKDFGIDFEENPLALLLPKYCVLSAFWFWKVNNLDKYASKGDFINVCSIWNTGRIQNIDPKKAHTINGLSDRELKKDIISKWCDKNKII